MPVIPNEYLSLCSESKSSGSSDAESERHMIFWIWMHDGAFQNMPFGGLVLDESVYKINAVNLGFFS